MNSDVKFKFSFPYLFIKDIINMHDRGPTILLLDCIKKISSYTKTSQHFDNIVEIFFIY